MIVGEQRAEAPPRVLTLEEYEKDWKPQGWELLPIGPTATYRLEWGEWEAIRDIVQNALDESESYRWGYDDNGLWIADRGRGIAVANFLLGPPRLKPDWARGKFGEGMKLAALALVRQGYSVRVLTAGQEVWVVFLRVKTGHEEYAESLHALWRPDGIHSGTRFHITGYTGSAFEDRFAVNLPRSAIVSEGPSQVTRPVRRFNQLIQYEFPVTNGSGATRIFARDIYMKDINSLFSYNLWSFSMAPDRHAPKNEADLWVDVGRLWSCVTRVKLLEVFMQMVREPPVVETEESRQINMNPWSMGNEPVTGKSYTDFIRENAPVWNEAWRNNFGDNAVIRTVGRWDSTVKHLGYTPVNVAWGVRDALSEVITTDIALIKASQKRLREAEVIPDEKLTARQLSHLRLARSIAALSTRYHETVSGVHAAIIPPASDRVRTAGMYSRTTQEIFISLDVLASAQSTVDTVIHEIAHHTSGAEDLEERHAGHMTTVAAEVVRRTAEGAFDELLKGVTW